MNLEITQKQSQILRERSSQEGQAKYRQVLDCASPLALLHGVPAVERARSSGGLLTLPTFWGMKPLNPEGIPSLSPGLRGTSYPGFGCSEDRPTPTGLHPSAASSDANPLGLRPIWRRFPRVARASQPWAELCNPFGIASARVPILWVMISLEVRANASVTCMDTDKGGTPS